MKINPVADNSTNDTLVPAKCTQCGATLTVDSRQDAAVCTHCGTPFIVQKAINNFLIDANNANININNANLHMPQDPEALEEMGAAIERGKIRERERAASAQKREKIIIKVIQFVISMLIFAAFVMWGPKIIDKLHDEHYKSMNKNKFFPMRYENLKNRNQQSLAELCHKRS